MLNIVLIFTKFSDDNDFSWDRFLYLDWLPCLKKKDKQPSNDKPICMISS